MNMQQYTVNLKLNILKEVTACKYDVSMKDLIVNCILESMIYSNNPTQSRMGKRLIGKDDMIIVASIVMKCPFKEKVYDVPIIIYFSKKIPYEPPQFFLDLPNGKAINPNIREIDPNTKRIMTIRLFKWAPTTDITSVLKEIQESFNRHFPIVNINSKMMMNQSVYNNNSNPNYTNIDNKQFNTYNPQQPQPQQHQLQNSNVFNSGMNPNNVMREDWTVVSKKAIPPKEVVNTIDKISSLSNSNDKQQALFTPEQADELIRQVLQAEIVNNIEGKIKEERHKMNQQKERLVNYSKLFVIEEKKMSTYLNSIGDIQQKSNEMFKDINLEISTVKKYLAQNASKTLNGDNIMDYINIGSETNGKIVSLIAQEAMIEELMSVAKKAFERNSNDFVNTIKLIRGEARSLFKVRYAREKLQQCNNTYI